MTDCVLFFYTTHCQIAQFNNSRKLHYWLALHGSATLAEEYQQQEVAWS